MNGRRDVRLIVGAVGVSSAGDFLLWVPLTAILTVGLLRLGKAADRKPGTNDPREDSQTSA